MKKIFTSFFILVSSLVFSQSPTFQWGKTAYSTWAQVCDIKIDNSGNVYLTGYFSIIMDFDPGPGVYNMTPFNVNDIYLVKLDASGNFVWAQQWDFSQTEQPLDITVDASGNIFVAGIYNSTPTKADGFLTKILSNGFIAWQMSIRDTINSSPNSGCSAVTVDTDPSGNVYVGGSFGDTMVIGSTTLYNKASFLNGYFCKFTSNGVFQWAKSFESNKNSLGSLLNGITVDNSGNAYVVGRYNDSTDFDPGISSYFVTIGSCCLNNSYITKLDPVGNFSWVKTFSGGGCTTNSVSLDNSLNIYNYGAFQGTVDFDPGPLTYTLNATPLTFFAAKLDASGNFSWALPVKGMTVTASDLDGFGNTYLSGVFTGTTDFDPGSSTYTLASLGGEDQFITKLDANGNFVWVGQIGSSSQERGVYASANSIGELANWGYADYGVDVDPGPLTYTLVGYDYVSKFAPGTSSGVTQLKDSEVSVFPNPTTGQFNLSSKDILQNAIVKITNTIGQIVLEKSVLHSDRISVNISDQPSGIYFIEVNADGESYRTKVVKE